jgi:hypothetical protein
MVCTCSLFIDGELLIFIISHFINIHSYISQNLYYHIYDIKNGNFEDSDKYKEFNKLNFLCDPNNLEFRKLNPDHFEKYLNSNYVMNLLFDNKRKSLVKSFIR